MGVNIPRRLLHNDAMTLTRRRSVGIACALAIAVVAGACGQAGAPQRAPDVHFEPTPHHVVAIMLDLAQVGPGDVVYDLGCGDGRIVIAAVKRGARGVCVDIDPERIRDSRANAQSAGVAERITFRQEDLFETSLAEATVVTLFLWPSLNLKLRPRLWRELTPGTRIVSYVHDMGDWTPRETRRVQGAYGPREVFLWTLPPPPRAASARSSSARWRLADASCARRSVSARVYAARASSRPPRACSASPSASHAAASGPGNGCVAGSAWSDASARRAAAAPSSTCPARRNAFARSISMAIDSTSSGPSASCGTAASVARALRGSPLALCSRAWMRR
ncbi:MAG: class I SAM-dependent methyltransferase [Variibacter sp.]|nr:class I SAM-dependent methyltransferase [Variibacter sp.]